VGEHLVPHRDDGGVRDSFSGVHPVKINFTYFRFPDHTQPAGALSFDKRSQACWYFYLQAQKMKENVGKSTEDQFGILEGELWMDTHYVTLARSVALIYGLESPDEFAKAWDEVRVEAMNCKLPEPAEEYTRLAPRFQMQ
jgi:hypothetical protein